MADNFVKDNKCFKPYQAYSYYQEISGLSTTLQSLVEDANDGVSIYRVHGALTTNGYPVDIQIPTYEAIMTIFNTGATSVARAAFIMFEYDAVLYYCQYYTDSQGGHFGSWKQVTVTAI